MPPRKKPTHVLPKAEFEEHAVAYLCPLCGQRNERNLLVVLSDHNKETVLTSSAWCTYKYCSGKHTIDYTLKRKKDNSLKLRVIKFLCDKDEVVKRFKILA